MLVMTQEYLFLKTPKGAAFSRNFATELASGDIYLDSDDILKTDKIEKQLNFMIATIMILHIHFKIYFNQILIRLL